MKDIALIAAMAADRVIGLNNQMPWHLSADLKHFKALTLGKPVVMGRKTFESLGRPLPGRDNIVISRNPGWSATGVQVYSDLMDALKTITTPEIMVIGGAQIFTQALPLATTLYLTFIDLNVSGDTFFPEIDFNEWELTEREAHEPDDKNPYHYAFCTFKKRRARSL